MPVRQMGFGVGFIESGLDAHEGAGLRLEKGAIVGATGQIIARHPSVQTVMGGGGGRLELEARADCGGRSRGIEQAGFLSVFQGAPTIGNALVGASYGLSNA
ncbi:hypothetical protein D3C80_2001410 [compost metagenome]